MPTSPGAVASNVRAELARRGISQRSAAQRLGSSQQRLNNRLVGRTPFTVDEIIAIAAMLDVPITVLTGGSATAVSA